LNKFNQVVQGEITMREIPLIQIVDDEPQNLMVLEAMLISQGYKVTMANNGKQAIEKALTDPPDLVLLDIMMPVMDGYETVQALKENEKTRHIPVVMVTALTQVEDRVKALESGADDFMTKPVDKTEVRARVRSLLKVKAYNDHMKNYQKELETEVARQTEELRRAFNQLKEANLETIIRLSRAAEYKDDDTGAHVLRMSHYAAAIACKMGYEHDMCRRILEAAPMHDVGKIGIPDSILLKPGPLNADEWDVMRRHPFMGKKILEGSDSPIIQLAETIAYTHHEKWDGTGYPKKLKGTDIPQVGRIVALADVFDALTTKRPYKEPFSLEKSFTIIREERDRHFDPEVVDAFFNAEDEILLIKEKYLNKDIGKLHEAMGAVD
jgi:putative two-component system response regulator